MHARGMTIYANLCGWTLARAHARSGDRRGHRVVPRRIRHLRRGVGRLRRDLRRPERARPRGTATGDRRRLDHRDRSGVVSRGRRSPPQLARRRHEVGDHRLRRDGRRCGRIDLACRRRSGSPSSTTTGPCGARSRCRSSSTSSSGGCTRWPKRQPELRDRQPWKAAYDRDYTWLGAVLAAHYAGDDTELGTVAAGVLAAHGGISVEEFERQAGDFLDGAQHPTLGRRYIETAYVPMVELLDLLMTVWLHELHRLRRRPGLHATDQPIGVRRPARAGHRQQHRPDVRGGRGGWRHPPQAGSRLPRRRAGEAGADLEPHRSPPAARGGELERRSPDARVHDARTTRRRCACWSSTTTPSASSPTPPAPRRRSSEPPPTGGRSSA